MNDLLNLSNNKYAFNFLGYNQEAEMEFDFENSNDAKSSLNFK